LNNFSVNEPAIRYGASQLPGYLSSIHEAANAVIGLSCFSVALALLYLAYRRPDIRQRGAVFFAVLFMFCCSLFSLFLVWKGWHPDHRIELAIKVLTAIVSVTGAAGLWPLVLYAVRRPERKMEQLQSIILQLEHEITERKRAEQALQQSRQSLRQLAAYQEQIKEDERKRIAREIHDELGQNLMALRIDVSLLHARTGKAHPLLNEKVSYVLNHIDMSIKAVRAIINNLRPSVLDLGLYAAIEWQVSEFERRTGIECEVITGCNSSDSELDDHRATALFRILQESLTNVARHAQATLVKIEVCMDGERLLMRIADNGVGLFPGCRRKPNSFGLLGIGERVSTLSGEFKVDSHPGEGTVLTISIPIEGAVHASETHAVNESH